MEINKANYDMKKIFNTIVILSVLALACACSKNGSMATTDVQQAVRFSGIVEESGTKTTLDETGRVLWEPGDAVNIFYDKNGWRFQSTVKEISAASDFVSDADYQEEGEGLFWAVYPYDEANTYDGESVVLSVPAAQTATDSSFDRKAFVTLAKSDDHNLMFRNLCGGIEVTVTTDYINKIVFKGNNNEILAGRVQVAFNSDGNPEVQTVLSGKTELSLVAPNGEVFKKGSSYYIAALPCDLTKGFTLEFYRDRTVVVDEAGYVSDRPVSVRRSVWGQVLRADEDSEWTTKLGENTFAYRTASGSIVSIAESIYVKSHYYDEMSGYYLLTIKRAGSLGSLLSGSDITEIVLPENITRIDDNAFSACTGLISVTIPSSVTIIGSSAFKGCTGLTSITFPSNVRSINSSAFEGCTGLTSVSFPSSLGSIGSSAFKGCTGLTSITIPSSVTWINSSGFEGCTGLTSVMIPSRMTSIESNIFKGCSGIAFYFEGSNAFNIVLTEALSGCSNYSITMAEGVTSIGSSAFEGCTGLTSITIPSSVTSIGEYAFKGCKGLLSVSFPSSLGSIGSSAFNGCTGLTSITIPSSVTSIGEYAFAGCWGLTRVTIPSSITSFGKNVFNACSGIAFYFEGSDAFNLILTESISCSKFSIIIADGVTSIGSSAFKNCTELISITIPSTVTSIGEYAFYWCTGLTSVTIPPSVTSIGKDAFYGCNKLTDVYISSLEAWLSITFEGGNANPLGSAQNLNLNGEKLTSLEIPSSVTSIGEYAFYSCNGLRSVTIPSSVTSIERSAFSNCAELTSVTIPSSVTSIGSNAFYSCSYLKSVNISSLEAWLNITFEGSSANPLTYAHNLILNGEKLTSLEIPTSVTSICGFAFTGYTELTSITIPSSIISIGRNAFSNCTGLTSVEIPSSVTSIGIYAFDGCTGLTGVYISSLEAWLSISFEGSSANPLYNAHKLYLNGERLTNITIPSSVTSIGENAFWNMTGLKNVTIPSSVTSIGSHAFHGCTGLANITIPSSVTSIGSCAFMGCTGLTSITLSSSVTSIGSSAFSNCRGLKGVYINSLDAWLSITFADDDSNPLYYAHNLYLNEEIITNVEIPSSVASIGNYAFYSCSGLTSVEIPSSLTSIGNYAFYSCSGLVAIYLESETPPTIGTKSFDTTAGSQLKIYVPSSSVDIYKTTAGWSNYSSKILANVL